MLRSCGKYSGWPSQQQWKTLIALFRWVVNLLSDIFKVLLGEAIKLQNIYILCDLGKLFWDFDITYKRMDVELFIYFNYCEFMIIAVCYNEEIV